MFRFTIYLLLLFISINFLSAQCRIVSNPSLFREVMRDDFDGSQINLNEWRIKNGCEHQLYFSPQNVRVNGGVLELKNSIDTSLINICNNPTLSGFSTGGLETVISKAFPRSIENNQLYPNGYMIFEAKVKFEVDKGIWPAFWLSGGAGEVDIFEFYHGNTGDAHFTNTTHSLGFTASCSKPWSFVETDFNSWHTFSVAWRVRQDEQDSVDITYFMDGKELWTQNQVQLKPKKGFSIVINNGFQDWLMETENIFLVDYISVIESPVQNINQLKEEYYKKLNMSETCSNKHNSIGIGQGNQIFFNHNDWMYTYHYNNNQWKLGYITQFQENEKIYGDIEVGINNTLYFKGLDLKLHKYTWNQVWSHSIVNNNNIIAIDEGSIATHPPEVGNPVVAISVYEYESDRRFIHLYSGNGNSFIQLGFEDFEECDGDINFLSSDKIIYRGEDSFLHMYSFINNYWSHSYVVNSSGERILVRDAPGSIIATPNDPWQFFIVDPNGWIVSIYSTAGNYNFGYLTKTFNPDESVSTSSNIMATHDTDGRIIYKNKFGSLKDYHFEGGNSLGWISGSPIQCGNIPATPVFNNLCSGPRNIFYYVDLAGQIQSFFWRCCESLNGCQNYPPGNVVFRELTNENEIDSSKISVGLEEESEFFLFPNPVNEDLFIESDKTSSFSIEVFDYQGRLLFFNQVQNSNFETISTKSFVAGNYYIRIFNEKFSKIFKVQKN